MKHITKVNSSNDGCVCFAPPAQVAKVKAALLENVQTNYS